jgi:hypothetical protein
MEHHHGPSNEVPFQHPLHHHCPTGQKFPSLEQLMIQHVQTHQQNAPLRSPTASALKHTDPLSICMHVWRAKINPKMSSRCIKAMWNAIPRWPLVHRYATCNCATTAPCTARQSQPRPVHTERAHLQDRADNTCSALAATATPNTASCTSKTALQQKLIAAHIPAAVTAKPRNSLRAAHLP